MHDKSALIRKENKLKEPCLFDGIENGRLLGAVVLAEGGELAKELLEAVVLQATGQVVAPPPQ